MNETSTLFARFRYFWWTLGIFAVFGGAAILFNVLSGEPENINSYDDKRRTEVRQEVDIEQSKLFPDLKPEDTFALVGKELLESNPSPAPAPEPAPEADPAPEAEPAPADAPATADQAEPAADDAAVPAEQAPPAEQ